MCHQRHACPLQCSAEFPLHHHHRRRNALFFSLSISLSLSSLAACFQCYLSGPPQRNRTAQSRLDGWLTSSVTLSNDTCSRSQAPSLPLPFPARSVSTLFRYLSVGLEKVVTSQAEQPSPGDKSALAAARSFMPFFAVLAMTNWIVELPRSHKWRLKHLSLEPASHTRLPHGHAPDPSSGLAHRPHMTPLIVKAP